ncbi:MAG: HU family DNA-binding protein [Candidatus Izemoplasmataceae bacterium]
MRQRRMRLFYHLSLLMIFMSFLVLLMLIVTLFYLTLNSGFNCSETPVEGLCVLNEDYQGFSTLLIIEVGFIAVFLILASYFQQYFLVDTKKQKVKVKKEKKRYTSIKAPKPLEEYVSPDLVKEDSPLIAATPIEAKSVSESLKDEQVVKATTEQVKEVAKKAPLEPNDETPKISTKEDSPATDFDKQEDMIQEETKQKKKKLKPLKIKVKKGLTLYEAPSEVNQETLKEEVSLKEDAVLPEANMHEDPKIALEESTKEETPLEDTLETRTETIPLTDEEPIEAVQHKKDNIITPQEKKETIQEETKPLKKEAKPITTLPTKPKKHTLQEKTANRRTKSHTKEDISKVLESLTGLTNHDARLFLDTLIDILRDTLIKHDKIAIHQFGTFTCSKLKARKMQVPSKDEAVTEIPAHYVVRFKGSKAFFDYLNDLQALPITPPEEKLSNKPSTKSKKAPKIAITKTKDDLIESILSQCEITPKEANLFIDTWIQVMHETLESEEKVALHQFGTFDITKHKEKKMVIPNTQEEKIVPAHNVIKFKPSKAFTDGLNTQKK